MQYRSTIGVRLGALVIFGITVAPSGSPAAVLTAGSNASALSAAFIVNGSSGSLARQAVAAGAAGPAYDKIVSLPSLTKSQSFGLLTLSATAKTVNDTASSAGARNGTIASAASASVGSISGKITSPLGVALTASATKLLSTAKLTKTSAENTPAATASIGGLSISSSVFRVHKKYAGK
ncbi:MAG TPA: hypothetical protein VH722_03170, partial [Alphaproteobacteria bacterium]|nr:hypothetical protein [Alphaproteobacteria bacterium]